MSSTTHPPKGLSWVLAGFLASSLVLAAGCNRTDTEAPTSRQVKPRKRQVKLGPSVVQASRPQAQASNPLAQTNRPPVRADKPQVETAEPNGKTNGPKVGGRKGEADVIFANPTLLSIEMEVPRTGMSALRRTHWGNGQERPIAKATVREGGVVYSNVAVHLKGAAGSFRSVDDKPAMTLSFDKFVPEQSFHGLHKISLNNSVQDPSYLCEKISREIFIAAGVPTPRASHALVTLNGRDLGLYVVLEGANKQFLKRYFNNAKGNLYDGGFCRDISTSLAVNSGENPNDHSGLRALIAAVRAPQPTFARLERVLDVDRFVSMMAIEMMLCHWDGYTLNRNNWRVFHDLDSNKMVFIPHGMDQMFGLGRQFDPGSPLMPQHVSSEVARAVLATREGQHRYRARASQLYTNVFKVDEIVNRVDEIAAGITSALAQSHPQLARSFQQRANGLKQRILRRGEDLRCQFGPPLQIQSLEFDSEGMLRLTGWKPSLVRSGDPVLSQVKNPVGNMLLGISAGDGTSSSSWRTRVALGPGRYQFEGRMRVSGVVIEPGDVRGGAGLRISRGTMPRKLTGTSAWTDYRYAFAVEDETADLELICELRAAKGEAWFDTASLKLVRLP
jgi:spore coat protein H